MHNRNFHYKYWTFCKVELTNLKSELEETLRIELERDYENLWEWVWNLKRTDEIEFNFSREHNWKTGEYDKPLRIIISTFVELDKKTKTNILNSILSVIKNDIYEGEFNLAMRELNEYKEIRRIKYET